MNKIEFDGVIVGKLSNGEMPDGRKVVNCMVLVPRNGRGVNRFRLSAKGELADKLASLTGEKIKIHVIGEPRANMRRLKNTEEKIYVPAFEVNAQEIEIRE